MVFVYKTRGLIRGVEVIGFNSVKKFLMRPQLETSSDGFVEMYFVSLGKKYLILFFMWQSDKQEIKFKLFVRDKH